MKKIGLLFMIAIIASITIASTLQSCGNKENKENKEDTLQTVSEKTITEKIMEANSVQEIQDLINGTTWHYTENLNTSQIGCWLKVTFKNGKYITYYAQPSDGKWTEGGSGNYEVTEGRYSNTGQKYYAVSWKGDMKFDWLTLPCEMSMTINEDGFQLNLSSNMLKQMNSITMGANEGAYYNATHGSNVYTGEMEYGDYNWN